MTHLNLINIASSRSNIETKNLIFEARGSNTDILNRMNILMEIKNKLIALYKQQDSLCTSINCEELFDLMNGNSKIFIIDCRSSEEFNESHLKHRNVINIPAEHIQNGYDIW